MKYEEAKPFLKEGMTVNITLAEDNGGSCLGIMKIGDTERFMNNSRGVEFPTNNGHWIRPGDELEILTNPDGTPWVHPDKSIPYDKAKEMKEYSAQQFKVGDRVLDKRKGKEGILSDNSDCLAYGDKHDFEIHYSIGGNKDCIDLVNLEKIDDEPKGVTISSDNINKTMLGMIDKMSLRSMPIYQINEPQAQNTKEMNIVKQLKDLVLNKESRILREKGFEDENGNPTELALNMMADELEEERFAARRLEIAKDLLKIKAEDCKK